MGGTGALNVAKCQQQLAAYAFMLLVSGHVLRGVELHAYGKPAQAFALEVLLGEPLQRVMHSRNKLLLLVRNNAVADAELVCKAAGWAGKQACELGLVPPLSSVSAHASAPPRSTTGAEGPLLMTRAQWMEQCGSSASFFAWRVRRSALDLLAATAPASAALMLVHAYLTGTRSPCVVLPPDALDIVGGVPPVAAVIGLAGTGKTSHLVRLAREFRARSASVLVVTSTRAQAGQLTEALARTGCVVKTLLSATARGIVAMVDVVLIDEGAQVGLLVHTACGLGLGRGPH